MAQLNLPYDSKITQTNKGEKDFEFRHFVPPKTDRAWQPIYRAEQAPRALQSEINKVDGEHRLSIK